MVDGGVDSAGAGDCSIGLWFVFVVVWARFDFDWF